MLSAYDYDSVGCPNRGSNDPFPFSLIMFFVIVAFVTGCYCGWKLHVFVKSIP